MENNILKENKKRNKKHTINNLMDYVKERKGTILTKNLKGVYDTCEFKCEKDHIWKTRGSQMLYQKSWCRKCSMIKKSKEHTKMETVKKNLHVKAEDILNTLIEKHMINDPNLKTKVMELYHKTKLILPMRIKIELCFYVICQQNYIFVSKYAFEFCRYRNIVISKTIKKIMEINNNNEAIKKETNKKPCHIPTEFNVFCKNYGVGDKSKNEILNRFNFLINRLPGKKPSVVLGCLLYNFINEHPKEFDKISKHTIAISLDISENSIQRNEQLIKTLQESEKNG